MYCLLMIACGLVFTGLLIFPIQNPLPVIISGTLEAFSMWKVADGK